MDRVINYPGSIPRSVDLLQTNRNVMTALGMLAQELFGTTTTASGFACTPTSPAGLSVLVGPGRLYSQQATDPLQYSSLPADTTDLIIKQGIVNTSTPLSCPAPSTSGQSVNYLVEVAFQETDTNPVVLPYYNAANPSQPFSGPNNSGSANYTSRQDTVQLQVKAGTPATTGTQVTPAPDAGFVGLWVVTVAYGQTTITSGNISQYPGAPLLGGSLLQAIQGNMFTYGADVGTANSYIVNYAPAVTTLIDGMTLEFQAAFANTGASTFSPNGVTAYPILGGAHSPLQGGEIISGSKCVVIWKANITSWILLESTGGALQVPNATKSNQAVNFSQIKGLSNSSQTVFTPALSTVYPRTLTFTAPCNGYVWAQQNINISNNSSTVALSNSISITGGATEGDTTTYPEQNVAVQYVTAGTSVTVTGTLTTGSSGAVAVISQCLSYIFIPSN
ncbi:hypothetical protein KTD31_17425 [Burkholderia multivorans]|uniref:hypothetical protein n=1 Tax=Burkholderia multivorans TaxID=87883 RepID=UPI000B32B489|nr:hypothetical protein [Burkholderia multivorans]MBU9203140.1 hypothetical protein [Burkholderia multivorans]MCA8385379.1 hypothetical protein [Burkholderia multivorans]